MQDVHDLCFHCRPLNTAPAFTGQHGLVLMTHILLRSILQDTNEGGHRLPQILNDHRLGLRLRSLSDP